MNDMSFLGMIRKFFKLTPLRCVCGHVEIKHSKEFSHCRSNMHTVVKFQDGTSMTVGTTGCRCRKFVRRSLDKVK